ncbi:MAG: 1,4-alpha-glucan branching enzyme, partial [Acidimicrobiales bacterium]
MVSRRNARPAAAPGHFERIAAGTATDPHSVLGCHDGVVRAWRPGATAVRVVTAGVGAGAAAPVALAPAGPAGAFEGPAPGAEAGYNLEVEYPAGTYIIEDPYRFWPTLGDLDLHLL